MKFKNLGFERFIDNSHFRRRVILSENAIALMQKFMSQTSEQKTNTLLYYMDLIEEHIDEGNKINHQIRVEIFS